MNRRQVLLAALATAALTATPLALAGVSARDRRAALSDAWQRAVKDSRALLVLVVPADANALHGRGVALGRWLAGRDPESLAPLHGVEVVCARLDELERLLPGVIAAAGAWVVLVRVDQVTPTWRSIVPPDPSRLDLAVSRALTREGLKPSGDPRHQGEQVRARLARGVPGATWGYDDPCPMCGMAVINPDERRFLDLTAPRPPSVHR